MSFSSLLLACLVSLACLTTGKEAFKAPIFTATVPEQVAVLPEAAPIDENHDHQEGSLGHEPFHRVTPGDSPSPPIGLSTVPLAVVLSPPIREPPSSGHLLVLTTIRKNTQLHSKLSAVELPKETNNEKPLLAQRG